MSDEPPLRDSVGADESTPAADGAPAPDHAPRSESAPDSARAPLVGRDIVAPGRWRSLWLTVSGGFLASLACHAVLILWAVGIFDGARPLAAAPPQSIIVDLVPDEAAPEAPAPQAAAPPLPAPTPPAPQAPAPQAPAQKAPDPSPPARAGTQPQWTPPSTSTSWPTQAPEPPATAEPPADEAGQKLALAVRLTDALKLPVDMPGSDGDTRTAETRAKLDADIVARFKSHLATCWTPPPPNPGASQVKLVIRVALKPDGTFAQDPMVIMVKAAAAGAPVMQSAMRALRQCLPYDFLPREQYKEWKVLDLAFSQQGIL